MDENQQQSDQPRPPDAVVTRKVLIGYGHQAKQMPPSTLATYKQMERDYTIGMCLGLLSFPIVSSQWTIEVKQVGSSDRADTDASASVRPSKITSDTDPNTSAPNAYQSTDARAAVPTQSDESADTAESIQQDLTNMLMPIWRDTVKHLLTAISRKAAAVEKRFDIRDGKIWLRCLDPVRLDDAELLVIEEPIDGQVKRSFGGMAVKVRGASLTPQQQREAYGSSSGPAPDLTALSAEQVPVPAWKTLWFAIDAFDGELVGQSIRMERAKRSWWSKSSEGGLLDVEDIWFRQRVTDPVEVYYREGTRTDGRNNQDVALEIGQSYQAHGIVCTPLGSGQTPETADFVVKRPEGQKESKQIPEHIDQSVDPRIMFAFMIPPLVGGAKQDIGAYSLGEVLVKFLLWNIEDIGEQVTQALTKWVLQQLVDWNWPGGWTVTLKIQSLAPEVVAMLREIVKGLLTGQQANKFISLLDIGAVLQESGLTLADDAAERIEQLKDHLDAGISLGEQLAAGVGSRVPGSASATGNGRVGTNYRDGAGGSGGTSGDMPPAVAARLKAIEATLDDRTDEASAAAVSFWDAVQRDLKKKTVSGRN
jgi:hypothetical protein